MIAGILWALLAGTTLGLYALPEKYTKDFAFENTWGLFFFINTFIVPNIAAFLLIDNFPAILGAIPTGILSGMIIASLMWGVGMMLWGKAINHIGLSLGFSLFIGTVILVGSLIPFMVDGLPETYVFLTIILGIAVVLTGVITNGRAGILRQMDEGQNISDGGMIKGITIAVIGGLLATGFSYANTIGGTVIAEAVVAHGNPQWVSAVAVMYVIYMAGGVATALYFGFQLTKKKLWGNFAGKSIGNNVLMTTLMAVFNFAASGLFAYSAYRLGSIGGTVGYAIFNTTSVAIAIISGIVTKEWDRASSPARQSLYWGLACMIAGIVIVALGNGMV